MALRGALSEVALADICQLLALGRKTGCLWLTDRSGFGYVYFEQGRVNYANVMNRPDRLGELLVGNGVIEQEDLDKALKTQRSDPDLRLGQILLEQGSLTEPELSTWVTQQVSEAVYHLFTWTSGTFQFESEKTPDEDEARLVAINAENLLLEGARRMDEWSQIEKRITSFDLIFQTTGDPVEGGLEMTPDIVRVLPLLDGKRTLAEVLSLSGLVEFKVGKAVHTLLREGFVEQAGQKASMPADTGEKTARHLDLGAAFCRAGMFEDAANEFRRVIELDPDSPEAHGNLADIELAANRPEAALRHFSALPSDAQKAYRALRNRSLALEQLDRHAEGLKLLDQVEAARPEDGDVFMARGIMQLKADDPSAASMAFRRYRERLGADRPPPVYFMYAVLAEAMDGDLAEAVRLGREGLAFYAEDPAILVNTGVVLERTGEPEAARAFYMRAVASPVRPAPAQAYKNLGDLAFAQGDAEAARGHYMKAVRTNPDLGPEVYVRLGEIAEIDGDTARAVVYWRRALELDPEHAGASKRLEASAVPA